MQLSDALFWTSRLLCLALLLQSIEMFSILHRPAFKTIWSLQNLKNEIPSIFLISDSLLRFALIGQCFLILISFWQPFAFGLIVIGLIQFLVCLRFRGVFNGGSDMMTFVVLIGLIISFCSPNHLGQELGLIYIAIHTLYSYFKAGLAKISRAEWRNGQALAVFTGRSLYPDVRTWELFLEKKKGLSGLLSFATLFFELSVISIIIFPKLVPFYFGAAILFHAVVYFTFGLNRFFWIWLAAWPALIFAINLLAHPSLA